MVELTDVLMTFAEAALVIGGLGGVVISFRSKGAHWSDWDKVEFRSILDVSGLVIFFAVLPVVLPALLPPERAWRISILLFAAAHGSNIIVYRLSVEAASIPKKFNFAHLVASTLILAQITGGLLGSVGLIQALYSLGLFWLIGIGGWLFYLLAMGASTGHQE